LFAEKRAGDVRLQSRAGLDFTATFPEIAEIVSALPFEQFIIDAEVVVLDARGLPNFSLLQKRGRLTRRADVARAALETPASIYAFDLLAFDGLDLRSLPLVERKAALRALLPVSGALRYSEHFESQGEALFTEAERLGLEGIVGKRSPTSASARRTGSRSTPRSPTTSWS
jgi:bifunctional non-homologous end joining protein LigD